MEWEIYTFMKRLDFEKQLNSLLEIQKFKDYCPNGVQIEGKDKIKKVAFSVSASLEAIQKAIEWGADALIVHHGILWNHDGVSVIKGPLKEKISLTLKNNLNLFAYHLPLDAHLELGNAAQLAKSLGAQDILPFGEYKGSFVGVKAEFKKSHKINDLIKTLEKQCRRNVQVAKCHSDLVKTISIVTGSGANYYKESFDAGIDVHITGEMSEYHWHGAKELGIHILAGGHHATERFGVLALADYVKNNLKLEVTFFDSDNPI
jgi:dinuclear metal center YbgI/SA1388 family protein